MPPRLNLNSNKPNLLLLLVIVMLTGANAITVYALKRSKDETETIKKENQELGNKNAEYEEKIQSEKNKNEALTKENAELKSDLEVSHRKVAKLAIQHFGVFNRASRDLEQKEALTPKKHEHNLTPAPHAALESRL